MKRVLTVLALAGVFTCLFAAVSGATYSGFVPLPTAEELADSYLPGYISFEDAQSETGRNNLASSLHNKAHGGYVNTSTRCAVCHSSHRTVEASPDSQEGDSLSSGSAINRANIIDQSFLTGGDVACQGCHVHSGAQVSALTIEWSLSDPGPHAGASMKCYMCHNVGIHGLASSRYNVLNVFMLGSGRGGDSPQDKDNNRDAQIAAELKAKKLRRGEILDVPANNAEGLDPLIAANQDAGSTWWYDGTRALGTSGSVPSDFDGAPNAVQYAAARSLAAGYTCGEKGCHTNSAMFGLNWGMGFERETSRPNTQEEITEISGHILPVSEHSTCGPCHVGGTAGFPTASLIPGQAVASRKAYGCDQCHDMIGVVTNTTAFPHGNKGILVYEWEADGTQIEVLAAEGNLWMYGGSIARKAGAESSAEYTGPNSNNPAFADQSWKVLTGVTEGIGTGVGAGLVDGACLKCHVAIDSESMDAANATYKVATRGTKENPTHEWHQLDASDTPTWDGEPPVDSQRLFLYK